MFYESGNKILTMLKQKRFRSEFNASQEVGRSSR
jgi:hypothetical protein